VLVGDNTDQRQSEREKNALLERLLEKK